MPVAVGADGAGAARRGHVLIIYTEWTDVKTFRTVIFMDDCQPVGLIEIAERLGVQRNTVDVWRQRGVLPEPEWTVGGRPAWNWPTIAEWARDSGRL